ncbi:MAG: DUF4115 domain-containing protein [Gammaproteobacteria bacterium]|nr:DUF4115 domain-containing protein [Gammaproteobacteria bacterium]
MNQEHDIHSPDESESTALPSFGTELRKARERAGQSVEEVANALFVRPHLISALENEDLSVFSAPVYAMGLLRSYARLLGIRPEPLLAALEGMEAGHEPVLVSVSHSTRAVTAANSRRSTVGMMVGAGVLLLILGVGLYLNGGDDEQRNAATGTENTGSGMEQQASVPEDLKATPEEAETAVAESEGDGNLGAGIDSRADQAPVAADDAKADAVDEPTSTDIAKPQASLLLIFETDSWAEVHDAESSRLLTRVGRAGQKLSLQGQPPFDVRLGYAPGVRIEYNGQPYVWEQRKGSRVAHILVGAVNKP